MIKPHFILACLFFTSTSLFGQNMGYSGKKNIVGVGASLNNGLSLKNGAVAPLLMLERSISVRSSIKASYSITSDQLDFNSRPVYINSLRNVFVPLNNYDVEMRFHDPITGDFKARIEKYSLAYRNYALRKGGIAPLGIFYEFGFNANLVDITELEAEAVGVYRREPMVIRFKNIERMRSNFDLGFRFAVGEKRFIDNRQFLEYSVGLSLDGMVEERSQFYSHMQAAHYAFKKDHLLRSFFHLNFIYGFAY